MTSSAQPYDLCMRCAHRRELHRPACCYNRPHGQGPFKVCNPKGDGKKCPAFVEAVILQ
jgi:hypothetical protein